MSTTNIPSALATFQGALAAYEAAKADLHTKHLAAEAAVSNAVSGEAAAALASSAAASSVGFSALTGELALLAVATGTGNVDKDTASAKIAELDASLKAFEVARAALDKARAGLDSAEDYERTRALALRARLAAIVGDAKK